MRSSKIRYLTIALLAAAITPRSSAQTTLYVDASVDKCDNSGQGGWSNAKKYLEDALSFARNNSGSYVIKVAQGTYFPDDRCENPYTNDPSRAFVLPSGLYSVTTIEGGYRGGDTDPDERDIEAFPTRLSGDIGTYDDPDDNSYHVIVMDGSKNVVLDGLTIERGNAHHNTTLYYKIGAGVFMYHTDDAALVSCTIRDNQALNDGAGLYISGCDDVTMTGCTVSGNDAAYGAGAHVSSSLSAGLPYISTLDISGCTFTDNTADVEGGGIFFHSLSVGSTLSVTGGEFSHNSAPEEDGIGGGVRLIGHVNATFSGVDFDHNDAYLYGSAIFAATDAALGGNWPTLIVLNGTFTDNITQDNASALVTENYTLEINGTGWQAGRTLFDGNVAGYQVNTGQGGAVYVLNNAEGVPRLEATINHCDFTANEAKEGGAGWFDFCTLVMDDCTFADNLAPAGVGVLTGEGGALWMRDTVATISDCTFDNNLAESGGGAIWAHADTDETTVLDLDDCKFRGNQMTDDDGTFGGGGVFLAGFTEVNPGPAHAKADVAGTWTNCTFIGNHSARGGGAYLWSTQRVDVKDCKFIANTTAKAGGALGIGDPEGLFGTEARVSKTLMISNTSKKGGAVHNHEGATTYLVNCRLTANSATEEGGAVFNSQHTGQYGHPELHMHNCLVVGNETDGDGTADVGGALFNDDTAVANVIHCTIFGNYAGYKYGGAVNKAADSTLLVRNSVISSNVDIDAGTVGVQVNLHYEAGFTTGDVDANVLESWQSGNFPGGTNTGGDPAFVELATAVTWTSLNSAGAETVGQIVFATSTNLTDNAHIGKLFRPSTSLYPQLLIVDNDVNSITCWGSWPDTGSGTYYGVINDFHIDDSGVADNYGGDYVPKDFCDLNGQFGETDDLPYDLDLETREVNAPDCGVYEIQDP